MDAKSYQVDSGQQDAGWNRSTFGFQRLVYDRTPLFNSRPEINWSLLTADLQRVFVRHISWKQFVFYSIILVDKSFYVKSETIKTIKILIYYFIASKPKSHRSAVSQGFTNHAHFFRFDTPPHVHFYWHIGTVLFWHTTKIIQPV